MIHLYFRIDHEDRTEEEEVIFQELLKTYCCKWKYIKNINGQDLYHGLFNCQDVIDLIMTELSSRSPAILGAWNKDGTNFGETKTKSWNSQNGNYDEETTGTATYTYKKTEVENYLDDICSYDESGSKIEVIGKLHSSFAGLELPGDWS